jgi:hypothetical protein
MQSLPSLKPAPSYPPARTPPSRPPTRHSCEDTQVGQRGLLQEGATLSAVGAAAASLPAHLRAVAASLASLHQLRHHVELADLRRVVLQYGVTEMAVLLREEAYRCVARGGTGLGGGDTRYEICREGIP